MVADLDLDMIEEVRKVWQFFRDRRPESYGPITTQSGCIGRPPSEIVHEREPRLDSESRTMTTPDLLSSASRIESSPLYNEDLAPATAERRHWGTYNFAALWVSMSVNILTYMLAASLIQGGMNWKQAVATIFLGNVIVLAPMLLNSHPGREVRNSVSRSGARFVRSAGRKRRRGSARAGRMRMVRHSDLDRRRSHQHSARDAGSGLEKLRLRAGESASSFSG